MLDPAWSRCSISDGNAGLPPLKQSMITQGNMLLADPGRARQKIGASRTRRMILDGLWAVRNAYRAS